MQKFFSLISLLGVTAGLLFTNSAQADPRVRYIIIDNQHYDQPATHWRGERLDRERYRAFQRDYRDPVLYGSRSGHRHHDRCEHRRDPYARNGRHATRDPYSRNRTYIVVPDRHSNRYEHRNSSRSERYYRQGDHHSYRRAEPRRYESGGRLVINF